MTSNTYVVIMAGGSGTRFWPHSRDAKPKQFLDVLGTGRSLLQLTFDRSLQLTTADKIWIVSNEKYETLIKEQLPELAGHQVLLEPEKRNTAPCIAYASYKIMKENPNARLVVCPSDHVILNEPSFLSVLQEAIEAASADKLLTIGIKPHRPETGYGYIQFQDDDPNPGAIKKVKTFTEKPEADLAQKFIESGDFLWNAGIFVWSIDAIIRAFETYDEELAHIFAKGLSHYFTEEEAAFVRKAYSQCKNISIDYAIMEKSENVYVIPGDFGWTDLGSWNALHEIKEKNIDNNVLEGDVLIYDSKNNFIKIQKDKIAVIEGLDGFLVADFEDVLLICKKEDSSAFRKFISDVKTEKGAGFI